MALVLAANLFIAAAFLLGAALLIVDIRKKNHLYQKEDPFLKLIKEEPVLCYPETDPEYYQEKEPKNSKENQMFNTTREAVQGFFTRMATLPTDFTAQQLELFVRDNTYIVPSSSTVLRALRELRLLGKLDFTVVNRARRLYKAQPLGTTQR